MASHNYQQFQYGLEKFPVTLYANVPIGATGAVGTLDPKLNQGIYSVVRNSAGNYTITFGVSSQSQIDKYVRLMDFSVVVEHSSISAVSGYQVTADAAAASGSVTIQFVAPTSSSVTTPVATDPESGAVLLMKFVLKNSSV